MDKKAKEFMQAKAIEVAINVTMMKHNHDIEPKVSENEFITEVVMAAYKDGFEHGYKVKEDEKK